MPEADVAVAFDVPATMRDGAVLRANVYRPAAAGRYPVLLTRLPYGKDLPQSGPIDPPQVARRGYVVVVQDARGRWRSEGEWSPFRHEWDDGVDTVAWAAALPFADGTVGMFGASYLGFTQWAAAVGAPPALRAIAPAFTWSDPVDGLCFRGGALELGGAAWWTQAMGIDELGRRYRGDPARFGSALAALVRDFDALGGEGYRALPLREFAPVRRHAIDTSLLDTVLDASADPARLDFANVAGKIEGSSAPAFIVGGWYDLFLRGTLDNFAALRARGVPAKLLLGPWSHQSTQGRVGELNFGFGSQAGFIDLRVDLQTLHLRWFDRYVRGVANGVDEEPPVRLFVMGRNVWRDEPAWPLARAVDTPYYLHAGGTLSSAPPGDEEPDRFVYDPRDPVPTRGGAILMAPEFLSGPADQRPIESRDDVLTYTSAPLAHDLEVTGPIVATLWAASDAPDTDFVARLVDVHPDGYAQNLTDGIVRARFRDRARGVAPSLIERGRAYEYAIDLWATSNVFRAGHRIRVDVTSSSFPRWDRNPNTGHALGADAELVAARQTVLHDAAHPSRVVLPVVPA